MAYPMKGRRKVLPNLQQLMLALLTCIEGHQKDEGPVHLMKLLI